MPSISKHDVPIFRCAFGVTSALLFATTQGYPLSHITAIFALMFLEVGKKPLGMKMEIGILIGVMVLSGVGIVFGAHLIDLPLVILPLLGLAAFWSFRLVKIPESVRLLFLILTVLLPFISISANMLGQVVVFALLKNLVVALVAVRIAYFLFPWHEAEMVQNDKGAADDPNTTNVNLDKMALNGALVVFPVITAFYLFNATSSVLVLVFILLLSFDPFIYESKKGIALISANILGGGAGILAFHALVIVPNYLFFALLMLSISLFFSMGLFSGKAISPLFKIGFNTFFVIMGTISTSSDDAGETLGPRLIQIGFAVLYVVLAFKALNSLHSPKISHAV